MIVYLDPSRVTGKKQTKTPPNRSRSGYGSKLPTSWMIQLAGGPWLRVYVICYSNNGSAYVKTKAGTFYLGCYDPST